MKHADVRTTKDVNPVVLFACHTMQYATPLPKVRVICCLYIQRKRNFWHTEDGGNTTYHTVGVHTNSPYSQAINARRVTYRLHATLKCRRSCRVSRAFFYMLISSVFGKKAYAVTHSQSSCHYATNSTWTYPVRNQQEAASTLSPARGGVPVPLAARSKACPCDAHLPGL